MADALDWRVVEGRQAPMTEEEFMAIEAIVMADAGWRAAMTARGLTDLSLAMIDPCASGYTWAEDAPWLRRICRPLTIVRSGIGDNGYARPVEGLIVTFDMDAMAVVDVEDHGVVPRPTRGGNYLPDRLAGPGNLPAFDGPRERMKPIEITQPEGASFTVDGRLNPSTAGRGWWRARTPGTSSVRPRPTRSSLGSGRRRCGTRGPSRRPAAGSPPASWATPYDPAERHAAGRYVAQNPGPDGLVEYTAGDRSLVDSDLVLWYAVGATTSPAPRTGP